MWTKTKVASLHQRGCRHLATHSDRAPASPIVLAPARDLGPGRQLELCRNKRRRRHQEALGQVIQDEREVPEEGRAEAAKELFNEDSAGAQHGG